MEKRHETDHSPATSAEVKKTWIHSPLHLHGIVLNYLNTGTALPVPFMTPVTLIKKYTSYLISVYILLLSSQTINMMMMMMIAVMKIFSYLFIRATTEQTSVLEVYVNKLFSKHSRLHRLPHLSATVTVPA
jgi:hypothetical protein